MVAVIENRKYNLSRHVGSVRYEPTSRYYAGLNGCDQDQRTCPNKHADH